MRAACSNASYECRFENVLSVELAKGHWLRGVHVVVTCKQNPHKLEVRLSTNIAFHMLDITISFCSFNVIIMHA